MPENTANTVKINIWFDDLHAKAQQRIAKRLQEDPDELLGTILTTIKKEPTGQNTED